MKIHHVGYCVKNIKKAEEEFKKLGFVGEESVFQDKLRKINILFMNQGNWKIELIEPMEDERSPVNEILKKNHGGSIPYHICYETENLKEQIEYLKTNHFLLVEEPQIAGAIGERGGGSSLSL